MDLTYQDVRDIIKIIDSAEHLDEIELVLGGFRLHVVRNSAGGTIASRPSHTVTQNAQPAAVQQATSATASTSPTIAAETAVPEGVIAIRAPMLGTFYRAPAPGEKPFIEAGQKVRADDTVCMIEVMKLFNSIRAGVDGTIVKILTENAAMVEFNQVLIHVAPSK